MKTKRTQPGAEGRLFPTVRWDNGWGLSIQADNAGYQCSPRLRLDTLEDYATVEVKLVGPFPEPVDPRSMDLKDELLAKFTSVDDGYSLGCNLTWDDVDTLKGAIMRAEMNAGIPPGAIGWRSRAVFHGTSQESADSIAQIGVIADLSNGYFGNAFYVAEEAALAKSNYADFSGDDDGGAVLEFITTDDANILDLRNSADFEIWKRIGDAGPIEIQRLALRANIDGVYDRSMGGLAIYNPAILSLIRYQHTPKATLKI